MNSLPNILLTIGFLVAGVSSDNNVRRKFSRHEKYEFLKEMISGYFLQEIYAKTSHISFAAKLSPHLSNIASHVVIKFDDVVTNQGNGYNKGNGTFTAPVSGTYLFAWHILVHGGKKAHTHLYVNGADTWRSFADAPGTNHEPASATVVLCLQKGDSVQLRTAHSGGNYLHGRGYSGFTGTLLYMN